jgi:hypothetical protein
MGRAFSEFRKRNQSRVFSMIDRMTTNRLPGITYSEAVAASANFLREPSHAHSSPGIQPCWSES